MSTTPATPRGPLSFPAYRRVFLARGVFRRLLHADRGLHLAGIFAHREFDRGRDPDRVGSRPRSCRGSDRWCAGRASRPEEAGDPAQRTPGVVGGGSGRAATGGTTHDALALPAGVCGRHPVQPEPTDHHACDPRDRARGVSARGRRSKFHGLQRHAAVGSGRGGFVIDAVGVGLAFAFNAASYLAVAVILLGTPLASAITTRPTRQSAGIVAGAREGWALRLVRIATLGVATFFTLIAPVEQLMPTVAQEHGEEPARSECWSEPSD